MSFDPWPLRHLVLRTPRLELRPDDDQGLFELAEEARLGVHPPELMPFVTPWTDGGPEERALSTLRWFWRKRAELTAQNWSLGLLVRCDGRVVGMQGLGSTDFAVTREVMTGSWLGLRHHGHGVGTEMRAAALMFAFDHLAALRARSAAFHDNPASLRVSEKLGYRRDGTEVFARRGEPVEDRRLLLDPADFRRPPWDLEVEGVEACLPVLGAAQPRSTPRANVSQRAGSPPW